MQEKRKVLIKQMFLKYFLKIKQKTRFLFLETVVLLMHGYGESKI